MLRASTISLQRLSMKTLLALDERRMLEDSRTTDKKEQPKDENSQSAARLSDCPCQNTENRGFNPIACFLRAAQEQVGAEKVAILVKGDVFTLSFSRKQPFPWDQLVSLESSIYVDDNVLKNTTPDALLDKSHDWLSTPCEKLGKSSMAWFLAYVHARRKRHSAQNPF